MSTREDIRAHATTNRWHLTTYIKSEYDRFDRYDMSVLLRYTAAGAVASGDLFRNGRVIATTGSKDRRAVVEGWLAERHRSWDAASEDGAA